MNIVLFEKDDIERPLPLRDERARHILKILHKQQGESFEAGIIGAQAGKALITAVTNEQISFTFTPESDGKPLYPLSMIIGFPRPIQLKRLFRDMAGLGVCEIHLAGTELGEKSYMQSTIVERGAAYSALLDGTAQAKSTHVPALFMYESVSACLASLALRKEFAQSAKAALDNVSPEQRLSAFMNGADRPVTARTDVYAAVGSERGWTDNERRLLADAGFISCGMGKRILRTETAATTAASIILSHMGVI